MSAVRFLTTSVAHHRYTSHYRDFDRFAALPPDQARDELGLRLLDQIRYFGRRTDALPEWREAAAAKDIEELWSLWPSLPVVSKDDLQGRFRPAEIQAATGVRGTISATGGSTGQPTPYLHDPRMAVATRAGAWYARRKVGWKPGMPLVCVWGSERDIGRSRSPRGRLGGWLQNSHLVDGYRLTDDTADRVLQLIKQLHPVALFGFTSMLDFVAQRLLARGVVVESGHVRAAWNGGEMLHADQRDRFEQAFQVPLLNLYGGRELSAMAYQPAQGAPLKVLMPTVMIELVNSEGQPVAPGESGRVLATSTVCRGTPFLRYEIGDLATCPQGAQFDGCTVTALDELQGRVAGLLTLPNGRTINCIFWNHLFKDIREVRQFQVVVRRAGGLELRLVGDVFGAEREAAVRGVLAGLLGPLEVTLTWVDSIPRTAQGKLEQVVDERTA